MRADAVSVHAAVHPHRFRIQRRCRADGRADWSAARAGKTLLPVPHAHIAHIGAGQQQQARAQRLAPVRSRAQFVVGHEGKFRRSLSAAVGAGRDRRSSADSKCWRRSAGSARPIRRAAD